MRLSPFFSSSEESWAILFLRLSLSNDNVLFVDFWDLSALYKVLFALLSYYSLSISLLSSLAVYYCCLVALSKLDKSYFIYKFALWQPYFSWLSEDSKFLIYVWERASLLVSSSFYASKDLTLVFNESKAFSRLEIDYTFWFSRFSLVPFRMPIDKSSGLWFYSFACKLAKFLVIKSSTPYFNLSRAYNY